MHCVISLSAANASRLEYLVQRFEAHGHSFHVHSTVLVKRPYSLLEKATRTIYFEMLRAICSARPCERASRFTAFSPAAVSMSSGIAGTSASEAIWMRVATNQ